MKGVGNSKPDAADWECDIGDWESDARDWKYDEEDERSGVETREHYYEGWFACAAQDWRMANWKHGGPNWAHAAARESMLETILCDFEHMCCSCRVGC